MSRLKRENARLEEEVTFLKKRVKIQWVIATHLPIDNNALENCMCPIALGKIIGYLWGAVGAGQSAAAIQSLLGAAKLNGLDPARWLQDTLEKLPMWPKRHIDELLPFSAEQLDATQLQHSITSG